MSNYKWCHGPKCHTYSTQDRIRGVKGSKVLRTRKIKETNWNANTVWSHFCSQGCYTDFMHTYWEEQTRQHPRREPLETPIEVEKVHHPKNPDYYYSRDWTETKITKVDNNME